MSFLDNPTFYVSIFSSVCLLASELLPFIPIEGNGILHTILKYLSSCKKNVEDAKNTADEIKTIISKLDDINNKLGNSLKPSQIV
jgi:hypothetical protein